MTYRRPWVPTFDLDWTAEPDTAITGTHNFGGVDWVGANVGNASAFTVQNGSGLVITPNATTDWTPTSATSPRLEAVLADMISGYSHDDRIRVLLYGTTTPTPLDSGGQAWGMRIHPNGDIDDYFGAAMIHVSGAQKMSSANSVAGSGYGGDNAEPSTVQVLEMDVRGLHVVTRYTLIYGSAFPVAESGTVGRRYTVLHRPPTGVDVYFPASDRLALYSSRAGTAAAITTTFKRLRIERLRAA